MVINNERLVRCPYARSEEWGYQGIEGRQASLGCAWRNMSLQI
jgi:hypothetical protein